MKLQNLITMIFTLVVLTLGSVTLADETSSRMSVDVVTVNVNEADAATIANTLSGVGLSRAQAIVDYRNQHGKFYSAEELTAVKGIGQSTVEKNLSRITTE
jgi:competence protein ComEA